METNDEMIHRKIREITGVEQLQKLLGYYMCRVLHEVSKRTRDEIIIEIEESKVFVNKGDKMSKNYMAVSERINKMSNDDLQILIGHFDKIFEIITRDELRIIVNSSEYNLRIIFGGINGG